MLLIDEGCQIERVISLLLRSHDQCLTIVECHTYILQGGVERDRGDAEYTLGIGEHAVGKHICRMTIEIVADTLMTEHHTLRSSRRSTGVDKISQIIARDIGGHRLITSLTANECFHINRLVGRNSVHPVGSGDDISGLTVFEDQFDTVGWIFRIAGDIGGSRLQYTEEREDESAGTWQQQCHTVTLLHTLLTEGTSNAVGHLIHLRIGVFRIDGHQCLMIRLCLGEMRDALVEELERSITRCSLS